MDQYIGKMLDNRYEILEIIGTGGMAGVYKATCHRPQPAGGHQDPSKTIWPRTRSSAAASRTSPRR